METKQTPSITAIDPVRHYGDILRSDRNGPELRFIPHTVAKELSSDPKLANIMLTHGYYNIRTVYARTATDGNHIDVLSADSDWRVRIALVENSAVPEKILRKLESDPVGLVAKEARDRLAAREAGHALFSLHP